ncbi:unnamed protein product [Ilex paraguariensis]|uniref:Uncharacterized protein n=1 Tax=Ilex paraguariensis TaxID=185542 RepID=A0ABC8TL05_9AQUA
MFFSIFIFKLETNPNTSIIFSKFLNFSSSPKEKKIVSSTNCKWDTKMLSLVMTKPSTKLVFHPSPLTYSTHPPPKRTRMVTRDPRSNSSRSFKLTPRFSI